MSGTQWWDNSTEPLVRPAPVARSSASRGAWPRATDYTQAIQDPSRAFNDPLLKIARIETTALGLPAAATGQNAIVFKVLAQGQAHAVRCFTPTQGEPSGDTYKRLAGLGLPEEMVPARWIENGIRVRQQDWPVLAMPWIAGDTLNIWLDKHAREQARVTAVRKSLWNVYSRLRKLNVVHGDLHHGNIIVTPSDEIRLVDFDGVCIFGDTGDAPLNARPSEVGHPNFQHPQRIRHGSWHRYTDTFAALVIDVSLAVIAEKPDSFRDTGDSLVFTRDDFESPSSSQTFKTARGALKSPEDLRLLGILEAWCGRQERADIDLESILRGSELPPASAYSVSADGGQRKSERVAADWKKAEKAPKPPAPSAGTRPTTPQASPSASAPVSSDGVFGAVAVIGLLIVGVIFAAAFSDSSTTPRSAPSPSAATPTPAPTPQPVDVVAPRCSRPDSRPVVSRGSRGADVRDLQTRLGVGVDGSFGPRTESAVVGFQRAQGLAPTGTVGDTEWALLGLTCPDTGNPVAVQFESDGVWPVGTCVVLSGEYPVAVACNSRHDAVITSLLRSSPEEYCPPYFWTNERTTYPRWFSWTSPEYFTCLAPSMSSQALRYEIGGCVLVFADNRVTSAPCAEPNTWTIYARVASNRECPSPTAPRDDFLRWVIVTEAGSTVHYCYQ